MTQVRLESELLIRFHRIRAPVLQFIGAQLIHQADAAPFLQFVDQQPPALFRDRLQRQLQLGAAIAAQAVEHIAGQALRMDAHQWRRAFPHLAHFQHDSLFAASAVVALKAVDLEVTPAGRKFCLSHFSKLQGTGFLHFLSVRAARGGQSREAQ